MKACYVEVFQETNTKNNLYFTTQPTSPKEALSIADTLANTFAKTFQNPIIYKDADADRQASDDGVEINVWELAKDEGGFDTNHLHIIIKEQRK